MPRSFFFISTFHRLPPTILSFRLPHFTQPSPSCHTPSTFYLPLLIPCINFSPIFLYNSHCNLLIINHIRFSLSLFSLPLSNKKKTTHHPPFSHPPSFHSTTYIVACIFFLSAGLQTTYKNKYMLLSIPTIYYHFQ